MDDQLTQVPFFATPQDLALGLDDLAQRIRNLINVARVCIIEIGRELVAASEKLPDPGVAQA